MRYQTRPSKWLMEALKYELEADSCGHESFAGENKTSTTWREVSRSQTHQYWIVQRKMANGAIKPVRLRMRRGLQEPLRGTLVPDQTSTPSTLNPHPPLKHDQHISQSTNCPKTYNKWRLCIHCVLATCFQLDCPSNRYSGLPPVGQSTPPPQTIRLKTPSSSARRG